jgi:DNA-directed RNA polymerase alpha subunit
MTKQTLIPRISGPFNDALTVAGYTTLEQLTELTARDLLKLHGVGKKGIGMLREVMKEHGLTLKGE